MVLSFLKNSSLTVCLKHQLNKKRLAIASWFSLILRRPDDHNPHARTPEEAREGGEGDGLKMTNAI